jgi:hypothetical protein
MGDAMQTEHPWAYHVMARGNCGDLVFRDDQDYPCFLHLLAQEYGRTGWRIHAYVLMPSHCHLLVETTAADPVAGIKSRAVPPPPRASVPSCFPGWICCADTNRSHTASPGTDGYQALLANVLAQANAPSRNEGPIPDGSVKLWRG